ncbi:hypothetical protein CB1_001907026 [Camelus ferus]|nr:hypothetical protein CB1_001907026 [Camelus ferus]
MNIALLSDLTKQISRDYGVLLEGAGLALRGLFIIDPNGVVKHLSVNDLPVGRSVEETLRLVKAFQFVETHGEVCPANWTPDSPTGADGVQMGEAAEGGGVVGPGVFVSAASKKSKVHDFTAGFLLHLQYSLQHRQWKRKLPQLSGMNVIASRSLEPMRGIEVMDKDGNVIGYSRKAGTKAVKDTATSRVVLFGTSAFIPEIFSYFFKSELVKAFSPQNNSISCLSFFLSWKQLKIFASSFFLFNGQ